MMNKYLILIITLAINFSAMAQTKNEKELTRKIELNSFNNRLGMEMGLAIIDLAKRKIKI